MRITIKENDTDCWTLNVTMGSSEPRPVADGNRVAVRPVASLFVRADHRVVDAYELGKFVTELRTLLSDPWEMEPEVELHEDAAAYHPDMLQNGLRPVLSAALGHIDRVEESNVLNLLRS